ncbi:MAG TPA: ATP-binding protein [Desulfobacterales bacterium]|nr:ATP-binding protein [Desulfobacterales bacterium]
MKKKYLKSPGHFVLPADLKISRAPVLTSIFDKALHCAEKTIVIDASNVWWISPFTACWLTALWDKIRAIGKTCKIIPPSFHDNARNQFLGLGIEQYLNPEASQTLPKRFSTFPVRKLIEPNYPLAGQVTRILTEKLRGVENFHKALHFAIREIIENAFEHGQTDHCYMCAYSVPNKQIVRLCILDTGIGIPQSMRSNRRYSQLTDDLDVVERSSEYGVSSKAEDRGIGLYLLRDVAEKNEAELTVLSGTAKIDISQKVKRTRLNTPFPGTAIKLMLKTRREFYYIDVADWEAL